MLSAALLFEANTNMQGTNSKLTAISRSNFIRNTKPLTWNSSAMAVMLFNLVSNTMQYAVISFFFPMMDTLILACEFHCHHHLSIYTMICL